MKPSPRQTEQRCGLCRWIDCDLIGTHKVLLRQDCFDFAIGEGAAFIEQLQSLAVVGGEVEVVQDDDDGVSRFAVFAEQGHNVELVGGVEGGDGFVRQQDVGFGDQGAGEQDPGLFAAGEGVECAMPQGEQVGLADDPFDQLSVLLPGALPGFQVWGAAKRDDPLHAHGPGDLAQLGQVGDTPRPLAAWDRADGCSVE